MGPRPAGWSGGDLAKGGSKKASIWLSPDSHRFVQQMKIKCESGDSAASYIAMTRKNHVIDSVKTYRVNDAQVVDIRCRPLPGVSDLAKHSRAVHFMGDSAVDSFLFTGTTKSEMNSPEFRQFYRNLGVGDY
ncbi:hypothetical protein [Luteolibacter luteus]|uniref:Uncharacterized protein n=1 Tax=Luteolibacter luteus TaxID=2728835 RepID=A0A858RPF4_9BACT|nr:hypothetical protein [Luteolibacter luteus]QJE98501.1 hypothetical protein HHL09_22840 [Luteolibacter luteus]